MLLVMGATAGEITVRNVSMLSKQADTAVCTALVRAGAELIHEADRITVRRRPLRAFEFDATQCPDLFPPLAALAAAAVANYLITPGLLCAVLMGLAALVITNGLQILLMTYQQGVAFSAASSLAGREILVTLPLTVLVYLPFRWVRRRIYSE